MTSMKTKNKSVGLSNLSTIKRLVLGQTRVDIENQQFNS